MKKLMITGLIIAAAALASAHVIDFEDVALGAEGYYNGADGAGAFMSRGATFNNYYDNNFNFWSGWAASRVVDTTTEGYDNQYASFAGGGRDSEQYGVAFNYDRGAAVIELPFAPVGFWLTNTTYAGLSMRNGDSFAKKFGGASGNDPDWFKLTVYGKDVNGGQTGSVQVYLADFRFDDNSLDYILDDWVWVDLTALGDARVLEFALDSSDVGQFGMNTPAYFAMDDLTVVPEPATITAIAWGLAALWRRRR